MSHTIRCDNCGETRDTAPLSLVSRVGKYERATDFCSFSCLAAWSQKPEARWWEAETPDEPVTAVSIDASTPIRVVNDWLTYARRGGPVSR